MKAGEMSSRVHGSDHNGIPGIQGRESLRRVPGRRGDASRDDTRSRNWMSYRSRGITSPMLRDNTSRGGASERGSRTGTCTGPRGGATDRQWSGAGSKRRKVKLGVKALQEMLQKDPDDLTLDMTSNRCCPATEDLLGLLQMEDTMIVLVVKVFARACQSIVARSLLLKLLNLLPTSNFVNMHLSVYLNRLPNDSSLTETEMVDFLESITTLFTKLLISLPNSYPNLPLAQLQLCVKTLVVSGKLQNHGVEASVETLVRLKDEKVEEVRKQEERKKNAPRGGRPGDYAGVLDDDAPPDNFREMSIILTQEDIHTSEIPFLRRNKVEGRYQGPEHYLDVQFRLLREDFIRPLREGINKLLAQKCSTSPGALQVRCIQLINLILFVPQKASVCFMTMLALFSNFAADECYLKRVFISLCACRSSSVI